MGCGSSIDIGHVAKTIVLGLGSNGFDVFSDVGNGLYHYYPKNVTRYLGNSTAVPDYCFPSVESNGTGMFDCEEEDTNWAMITFACIQLPAVVLAVCAALAALAMGCRSNFDAGERKMILGSFLLLLVPFPILVFIQQVASLFISPEEPSSSLAKDPSRLLHSSYSSSMSFCRTLRGKLQ